MTRRQLFVSIAVALLGAPLAIRLRLAPAPMTMQKFSKLYLQPSVNAIIQGMEADLIAWQRGLYHSKDGVVVVAPDSFFDYTVA